MTFIVKTTTMKILKRKRKMQQVCTTYYALCEGPALLGRNDMFSGGGAVVETDVRRRIVR